MSHSLLIDRYGREISYLRVSLTEQCNFRCTYCMPPEGVSCSPSSSYLTPDEISRLVATACELGIRRVRLTGGEPTLRDDLVAIVKKLSGIPELDDLAMTTNGSRLKNLIGPLKRAGLKRVNVSLDSLNRVTFAKMALRDAFDATMDGILACLSEKVPVKVNTVVMRGVNDGEIPDFVEFALANPLREVRFIEFMPLCGTGWKPDFVHPLGDVIANLKKRYEMEKTSTPADDVAESYVVRDGKREARVGFITTLSKPFCGACSRLRLSATGFLRPCLFSHEGVPVRGLLRGGAPREEIVRAIREAVQKKPKGNGFAEADERGMNLKDYLSRPIGGENNPGIRAIGG